MNDNNNSKYNTTKVGMSIRVLVGAYLIYLAYGIFKDKPSNTMIMIAAIFFVIAGAFLVIYYGIKSFQGQYIGGKADDQIEAVQEAELIEDGTNETVEADVLGAPSAKEQAMDFSTSTTIETVEEDEITKLD